MARYKKIVKWLSPDSFLVFLKGLAVQILAGAALAIAAIPVMIITGTSTVAGAVLGLLLLVAYMFTWGFLARKMWGWN